MGLSIYEESHILPGPPTGGDADSSEKPREGGRGPEKTHVGDIRSRGASGSEAAPPTPRPSGAALRTLEALLSVPKTLKLLALIDFVCLTIALDLELNTEPSGSFAFRSRRCPTVSDSRGFFMEKWNILGICQVKANRTQSALNVAEIALRKW
jgi:hypothetical protein